MESVLQQTYTNLEVIIVNDGSTDNTDARIQPFTADNRVRYINQPNGGVSAARNVGIGVATGAYLAFVDSDDYLTLTMYDALVTAITASNADMAVCNYNLIYDTHTVMSYSQMKEQAVDIKEDIYGYFARFCACPKPNNYIWSRLYKTDIIKKSGVLFEQYPLADDTLFNFKLLPHLNKVTFISQGLYNYYQRESSNIYTVANKHNLATVYADVFDALEAYWKKWEFNDWLQVLPLRAFSCLRNVYFYARLAGLADKEITECVIDGFNNRNIKKYLLGGDS
ncbi:MAG: glycosyltransferase [Defluviitaleaceae bacterium]|nr:glycosyltransferase [Defluviitaleaceae bacterium]